MVSRIMSHWTLISFFLGLSESIIFTEHSRQTRSRTSWTVWTSLPIWTCRARRGVCHKDKGPLGALGTRRLPFLRVRSTRPNQVRSTRSVRRRFRVLPHLTHAHVLSVDPVSRFLGQPSSYCGVPLLRGQFVKIRVENVITRRTGTGSQIENHPRSQV